MKSFAGCSLQDVISSTPILIFQVQNVGLITMQLTTAQYKCATSAQYECATSAQHCSGTQDVVESLAPQQSPRLYQILSATQMLC